MNIHEHQAKEILKNYGAKVPEGFFAITVIISLGLLIGFNQLYAIVDLLLVGILFPTNFN